jgi:hypothetical protein
MTPDGAWAGRCGRLQRTELRAPLSDQILVDIQAHLIPGGLLIPAAVGELVRLQDKGYRLVVNG